MAFGGGDGVRYPPPVSGRSKLNKLTWCRKNKSGTLDQRDISLLAQSETGVKNI